MYSIFQNKKLKGDKTKHLNLMSVPREEYKELDVYYLMYTNTLHKLLMPAIPFYLPRYLPAGFRKLLDTVKAENNVLLLFALITAMLCPFSFGDPTAVVKIVNSDLISYSIQDSTGKSVASFRTRSVAVKILLQHVKLAKGPQEVRVRRRLYPGEEPTAVLGSARCVFWNVSLGYGFSDSKLRY
jgi:hypothetical protein